ncbi:MAG: TRCF domain-containing protein, partial [Bdellovibrionota bacterium]|nr:TRCF domain-containing protein [Bdellovibrionota bacterium]
SGDILGGNQSGHVEAVGLELYMELLKEAVNELRGEKVSLTTDLEVTTQFPSFIPKSYINDDAERLKQYKRLSNCNTLDNLETNKDILIDIYGSLPQEVQNLFLILECRLILQNLAMTSFKITAKNILISFDEKIINSNETLRNNIVSFFMERPKVYQFNPNYQVNCSFKDQLSQENIRDFAQILSNKILPTS